jgi:hypothetical protein
MKVLHNLYFRHRVTDAVMILVVSAEPVRDLFTFGDRPLSEVEREALDLEALMSADLCSIVEVV